MLYGVDMALGTREKYDLYTANPLLGYYWAVPGVFLAKFVDNLYDKTMLMRIPFAVTGSARPFHFCLIALENISGKTLAPAVVSHSFCLSGTALRFAGAAFKGYASLFSPYPVHRRCTLSLYKRRILKSETPGFALYAGGMVGLLFLIFNAFYPLFYILIATLGLHESLGLLRGVSDARKADIRLPLFTSENLKPFLPLIASVVLVFPLMVFFRTFEVAHAMVSGFNIIEYFSQLLRTLYFLTVKEFLLLALFMKAFLAMLLIWQKHKGGTVPEQASNQIRVSNFLTLFFVVHLIVIARMTEVVYTRYFIVLQPVLTLILLLDAFAVFELFAQSGTFSNRKIPTWAFIFLAVGVFLINCVPKIEDIKGHVYELTHRYKGPLDFVIPYIKANYKKPEDLVIATNYEEHCYMYYLGSKVIVGFVGNNLKDDLQETPDIIIYRKSWSQGQQQLAYLWQKAQYKEISFPVADYLVNNIPELMFCKTPVSHPDP